MRQAARIALQTSPIAAVPAARWVAAAGGLLAATGLSLVVVGCAALDTTSAACEVEEADVEQLRAAVRDDPVLTDPHEIDTCGVDSSGGGVREVTASVALEPEEAVRHLGRVYGCEPVEGGEGRRLVELTGCAVGGATSADASVSVEPGAAVQVTLSLTGP